MSTFNPIPALAQPDWTMVNAAIWRPRQSYLKAVQDLDPVKLDDILEVDLQKQQLCDNTERFLRFKGANNALLWGPRGTGKSSLIKALLNQYAEQGLRLIQIDKDDMEWLPEIIDGTRQLPFHFIIFIDDLSFEAGAASYKSLKSALGGSIERPPKNVIFYATSNRRHLLPEGMQDNLDSALFNADLHYADAVEEKISLPDRFGLWLSFYAISQAAYLRIIDSYFPNHPDRETLHTEADRFATEKGGRSGRTAKQYFNNVGV